MELNSFIQQFQHKQNISYQSNGIAQGYLQLKPLDYYLPRGINRKACIHIAGSEEVGKTSLGLEFAYRNPDYIFIYIDTYFKLQEKDIPDNVYLFRSNNVAEISAYLNTLESKSADFIMVDAISNLLLPAEQCSHTQYINNRYVHLNIELTKVIEKCCNLNICLILFNTLNANGSPFNYSTQLKYRCSLDLEILSKEKQDNDSYIIEMDAKKWLTRTIEDSSHKTILLTGQGDDLNAV